MFKSLLAATVLSLAMIGSASATGYYTIIGGVILSGDNIGTAIYQPIDTNSVRVFYSKASCERAINDFVTAKLLRKTSSNDGSWPEATDYRNTDVFTTLKVTKTVAAACVLQ